MSTEDPQGRENTFKAKVSSIEVIDETITVNRPKTGFVIPVKTTFELKIDNINKMSKKKV